LFFVNFCPLSKNIFARSSSSKSLTEVSTSHLALLLANVSHLFSPLIHCHHFHSKYLTLSLPSGKCLLSGQCLAVFVEHARGQVLVVRPSDCSPSNAYPLEILGILEPGKYAVPIGFHIENTFLPIFER